MKGGKQAYKSGEQENKVGEQAGFECHLEIILLESLEH